MGLNNEVKLNGNIPHFCLRFGSIRCGRGLRDYVTDGYKVCSCGGGLALLRQAHREDRRRARTHTQPQHTPKQREAREAASQPSAASLCSEPARSRHHDNQRRGQRDQRHAADPVRPHQLREQVPDRGDVWV